MRIARMKEVYDYYSNLSSGAVQALMQAEEASVDARYDAEIEAARKAGNDTTELENKKAGEKLKIQKNMPTSTSPSRPRRLLPTRQPPS